jgi:tetratricopeptide (TPR) repeat protein
MPVADPLPSLRDDPLPPLDYAQEIPRLTQLIENDPDKPVPYMSRARAYAATGDYPKAIADVRTVFAKGGLPRPESKPGGPLLKGQAAEECMSRQDYKGAIHYFDQAVAFLEEAIVYLRRGTAHQALGHFADAYHDFSKAIQMGPHVFEHHLARARLLEKLKLYEDAVPDFDKAIAIDDTSALAYLHRGLVYEQLGKMVEAAADRAKVQELNPNVEKEEQTLANLEKQGVRLQVSLSRLVSGRIAVFSTPTQASKANLESLRNIKDLKGVHLGLVRIDDATLAYLKGLPQLEYLDLWYTGISDAGLVHLQGLTKMRQLSLGFNDITDTGMRHLTKMSELRTLVLANTEITDASIDKLAAFKSLDTVQITSTKISPEGVKRLKKELPEAKIAHD